MLQCKQVIAEDRKKELVEKMANLANSNLLYELSLMMTLDDMAIVYIASHALAKSNPLP